MLKTKNTKALIIALACYLVLGVNNILVPSLAHASPSDSPVIRVADVEEEDTTTSDDGSEEDSEDGEGEEDSGE